MSARNVAFVAFQDQPNLGIGYLASVLVKEGFNVEVLDYRKGFEFILEHIRKLDPLFIGLSVVTPVLGHATWRFYRRAIERASWVERPIDER